MKNVECRTASVLLTEDEVDAIKTGLRIIYRPLTLHWDQQFTKFKEAKQATLMGFEVQDIVHLMREIDKMIVDKHGRERKAIMKFQSRVLKRIHDTGSFPEDYRLPHRELKAGDQCWVLTLGEKVGK